MHQATLSCYLGRKSETNKCHNLFIFFLTLSEHYLATVTWVTDDRIAVQWLKRLQNHLILQIYTLNGSRWDPVEVKHDVMSKYYFCFPH